MKNTSGFILMGAMLLSGHAFAADVIRHKTPGSDFPIAMAVEIPAGKTQVHLSGVGPKITDKALPPNAPASYGNTREQTISVLEDIRSKLQSLKLDMKDVVKMQAFLVGDPAMAGKMDFSGFMEGYVKFFGTAAGQPNLPSRSTVQVAGLPNPGWLVEIEVTAVRSK
jgi:enamine deaminase RidA (YjgF/YER057c/UK114 family)